MIRMIMIGAGLALLAACGADGEPVQPKLNAGVSVSPSGVKPSASVSVGPVIVNLGVF